MDPRTDLHIWRQVLDSFRGEQRLDGNNISIDVRNGIVSLEGSVTAFSEKGLASQLASRVPGVVRVSNNLRVVPSAVRDDAAIVIDVRSSINNDERLDLPSRIGVTVDNGVVALTGTVESFDERENAAEDAEKVNGVIDVNNNLQVVLDVIRHDAEIQNDIRQKLIEDIVVDAKTIEIYVNEGIVTLVGTVPSLFQKQAAEDDAWAQPGVRGVVNELRVWFDSGI